MNKELITKLSEFALAMQTLEASLKTNASASLLLKKKLLALKIAATEKEVYEAFVDEEETAAEEAAQENLISLANAAATTQWLAQVQANVLAADDIDGVEIASEESEIIPPSALAAPIESFSLSVVLNAEQVLAKDMAAAGKSFCLIGAAGTGKTTAQRATAKALLQDSKLSTTRFKTYHPVTGEREYKSAPSIAFCAYTRRAAANLAKAIHKDPELAEEFKHNIMTIHMLLEYEPEQYDELDPLSGEMKSKFRFVPRRDAANPLTITHLIIEEASMVDAYQLWQKLFEALPDSVQIIFIGDINQLPPVFGPSVLNFALLQLPVIELKKVYRNQGIVLENAHNVLAGKTLEETADFQIIRGKHKTQQGQEVTSRALGGLFNQWLDITGSDGAPEYDPSDCIILSPYGKQPLGTRNLNSWISQHLGQRRGAVVHEVIAGFEKHYLAIGDKVMFNKLDGVITDIVRNPNYHGKEPQIAGTNLTRFGMRILNEKETASLDEILAIGDYSNFNLESLEKEKGERKQQASHIVKVKMDNGNEEELTGAGDFGEQSFSLGYALTVHKAQGSEWRKVFLILHKDFSNMLYRELFYTAVTRARTKVTIIAKDDVINRAILNQRIKGNTMEDKINYFNAGIFDNAREPVRIPNGTN